MAYNRRYAAMAVPENRVFCCFSSFTDEMIEVFGQNGARYPQHVVRAPNRYTAFLEFRRFGIVSVNQIFEAYLSRDIEVPEILEPVEPVEPVEPAKTSDPALWFFWN